MISDVKTSISKLVKHEKSIAKSVVRVYFPVRKFSCSYYNDSFDLKLGDYVYVEGKMENLLGRVIDVSYDFKIKLSDYKKVIALADTDVQGEFCFGGSHFITFDSQALDFEQVSSWYFSPSIAQEEFVSGSSGTHFSLDNLSDMNISKETADKGHDYYLNDKVVYLELKKNKGRAIVIGSQNYVVEFEYYKREISNITCSCYCSGNCKHTFAVLLQLLDILKVVEERYPSVTAGKDYIAAVSKISFFSFVVDGKTSGSFTFE